MMYFNNKNDEKRRIMSEYEIANIVFGSINSLFIIIGSLSIVFMKKQIKMAAESFEAEREEKKREKTVDIIHTWTNDLKKEARLVEELLDGFTKNQCKSIYEYRPFDVDKEVFLRIIEICFFGKSEAIDTSKMDNVYRVANNKYTVKGAILTELRWLITSYLNSLEVVALSWQQGLVDRDTLCEQYSFLVYNGRKTMEKYRCVAGNGASYPAIEAFCAAINEYISSRRRPKPKSDIHLTK